MAIDIRPAEPADAARIRAWRALPEAWAALSADPLLEADAQRAERQDFIVEADGTPAGLVSLYELDRKNARAAFVAFVVDAKRRQAGVEEFVEYWVLEYAFEGLKLAKLWSETPVVDEAACSRRERFGFRREARFRGHLVRDGTPVDVAGLGILAADWRAHRPDAADRLRALGFEPPEIP